MADKKFSLSVLLSLNKQAFEKGLKAAQQSIKTFQSTLKNAISTIGVGMGLGAVFSQLTGYARKLDEVKEVLKNASTGTEDYAERMAIVRNVAKTLGSDISEVGNAFARFTRSATEAGISVKQQGSIFLALQRAMAGMGVTGSKAEQVMDAVQKAITRGKLSSREFTAIIKELPELGTAIAQALGTSTQAVEAQLKKGVELTAPMLGKITEELNKLKGGVNLDTTESSIATLKTALTELGEKLRLSEGVKFLADTAVKVLTDAATAIKAVISGLIAWLGTRVQGHYKQAQATRARALETAKAQHQQAATKLALIQEQLTQAYFKQDQLHTQLNALEEQKRLAIKAGNANKLLQIEQKLFQQNARIQQQWTAIDKLESQKRLATQTQTNAAAVMNTTQTTGVFSSLWRSAVTSVRGMLTALKGFFSTTIVGAVLGAVTWAIGGVIDYLTRAGRKISEIQKQTESTLRTLSTDKGTTQQTLLLEKQLQRLQDQNTTLQEKKRIQQELARDFGIEVGTHEKIEDALRRQIALLRAKARQERAIQEQLEAEKEMERTKEARALIAANKKQAETANKMDAYSRSPYGPGVGFHSARNARALNKQIEEATGGAFDDARVVEEHYKRYKMIADKAEAIIDETTKQMAGATLATRKEHTTPAPTAAPTAAKQESPYQRLEREYSEQLNKLQNQLKAEVITHQEFTRAASELSQNTLKELAGALGTAATSTELYARLIAHTAPTATRLQQTQTEYNQQLQALQNQLKAGVISQDEYNNSIADLNRSTAKRILSSQNITQAEEDYAKKLHKATLKDYAPTVKERDTSTDYKKNPLQLLEEEATHARSQLQTKVTAAQQAGLDVRPLQEALNKGGAIDIDALKESLKGVPDIIQKDIAASLGKVQSLEDALKLKQVQTDVRALKGTPKRAC